jgi:bile acid:Na+ symporter, BASS family
VDLTTLIVLTVKLSIILSVMALGLRATLGDATHVLRSPRALGRAFLSMNVVLPIAAVVIVRAFDLHPAVKMALVALSVSPVPPILPGKALKAGGSQSYTIGLLTAMAVLSIVTVPLALELLQTAFSLPLDMPVASVALVVSFTVLLPLTVGIAFRAALPRVARRLATIASALGGVLLLAGGLVILLGARASLGSLVGDGTVAAFAAWSLVGVVVGHWLGGPEPQNRPVLALATASRHPAVAIAIEQVNFPQQKLAVAAVLLFLIVNAAVTAGYLAWFRRHRRQAHSPRSAPRSEGAPSRPAPQP